MPVKGSYIDLIPSGTPPATEGRLYYDSSSKKVYFYNGSQWIELAGGAKIQVTEFTSSGTYYTPSGAKMLIVYIAGAGGGGGVFKSSGLVAAGGGAGGSLTIAIIFNPEPSYTVTVGAGGQGGQSDGASGNSGGYSAFGTIYANGGGGGAPGNYGTAPEYYTHPNTVAPTTSGTFYLSYRGCRGGAATENGESGYGHSGGAKSSTNDAGGGGAGPFGNGGAGGAPGKDGEITAGGGASKSYLYVAGNGGNGKVVVVAVI